MDFCWRLLPRAEQVLALNLGLLSSENQSFTQLGPEGTLWQCGHITTLLVV